MRCSLSVSHFCDLPDQVFFSTPILLLTIKSHPVSWHTTALRPCFSLSVDTMWDELANSLESINTVSFCWLPFWKFDERNIISCRDKLLWNYKPTFTTSILKFTQTPRKFHKLLWPTPLHRLSTFASWNLGDFLHHQYPPPIREICKITCKIFLNKVSPIREVVKSVSSDWVIFRKSPAGSGKVGSPDSIIWGRVSIFYPQDKRVWVPGKWRDSGIKTNYFTFTTQ